MQLKDAAGNFASWCIETQSTCVVGSATWGPQMLMLNILNTTRRRNAYIISATGNGAAFNSICRGELCDWARIRLGRGCARLRAVSWRVGCLPACLVEPWWQATGLTRVLRATDEHNSSARQRLSGARGVKSGN